jgi:dinuclear metal center YbgI/SA1388 family protein
VGDVVNALFERAPAGLAESWDNVGLVVGRAEAPVRRCLLATDITPAIVEEAAARKAQAVIAHHPPYAQPTPRTFVGGEFAGEVVLRAARHEIALIAMHTNLDAAPDGLCDLLAQRIGLSEIGPLGARSGPGPVKFVVFVPTGHADAVREAIAAAGAGRIGDYEACAFLTHGTGTFRPLRGAKPHTGKAGRLERVEEVRVEALVPKHRVGAVVAAAIRAHPYEEVAYDLIPLENESPAALGRIGTARPAITLAGLARRVRERLGAASVALAGDGRARVARVAVGSGGAGFLVEPAAAARAEALVVGEIKHHEVLWARALGLAVIAAGHHATERLAVEIFREVLRQAFGARISALPSRADVEPLTPIP